ncbi:MAG TPA: hypothetical protein VHP81_07790 [Lachnospiraceae bacterium]|nr:hypothetical protein [Lachnospiraceae bacterium]
MLLAIGTKTKDRKTKALSIPTYIPCIFTNISYEKGKHMDYQETLISLI